MDVLPLLVPQIKQDIVEVPPRRVPQVMEQIMKVTQSVPFERIQKRVGEQIAAVPVPHITEDIVEVSQHVPQERVPNPIVEQSAGAPDQQGHRGYDSACASGARTSRGADRRFAGAPDQQGHRGYGSACTAGARATSVSRSGVCKCPRS